MVLKYFITSSIVSTPVYRLFRLFEYIRQTSPHLNQLCHPRYRSWTAEKTFPGNCVVTLFIGLTFFANFSSLKYAFWLRGCRKRDGEAWLKNYGVYRTGMAKRLAWNMQKAGEKRDRDFEFEITKAIRGNNKLRSEM